LSRGQITNSTPGEFLEFLRENVVNNDLRTVVFLNSQGGYVVASMELGQMFRRIGAATVVARLGSSGQGRFLTASAFGLRSTPSWAAASACRLREALSASIACSPT